MDQDFKFDQSTKIIMNQYYSQQDIITNQEVIQKSSIMKLENGYKYRGEISSSKIRQGYGVLQDKDGKEIYCGQWSENKYDGRGLYINLDSTILKGKKSWKNLTTIAKGWSYYEGEFKQGFMHGSGILIFSNNEKYQGSFSENLIDGQGQFTDLDSNIVYGIWEKGTFRKNYIPEYNDKNQIQKIIETPKIDGPKIDTPLIEPLKVEPIIKYHHQKIIDQQQQGKIQKNSAPSPQLKQILQKSSQLKQGDEYNQLQFEEQRMLIKELLSIVQENTKTLEDRENTIDIQQTQITTIKIEHQQYIEKHLSERKLCDDIITSFQNKVDEVTKVKDNYLLQQQEELKNLKLKFTALQNEHKNYIKKQSSESSLFDEIIIIYQQDQSQSLNEPEVELDITQIISDQKSKENNSKQFKGQRQNIQPLVDEQTLTKMKQKKQPEEEKFCPICSDQYKSHRAIPCGYLYCRNCSQQVMKQQMCLICRVQVTKL